MPRMIIPFFVCGQLPIPQHLTHNIYSDRVLNITLVLEHCKGQIIIFNLKRYFHAFSDNSAFFRVSNIIIYNEQEKLRIQRHKKCLNAYKIYYIINRNTFI